MCTQDALDKLNDKASNVRGGTPKSRCRCHAPWRTTETQLQGTELFPDPRRRHRLPHSQVCMYIVCLIILLGMASVTYNMISKKK
jgi:hypothetical protein